MEYLYWVSCIVGFFYVWDRLWWRYQRNLKQKLSENKQLSAQQVWDYTVGETKYSQLVRFPDGDVEITNPAKAIKVNIPDYAAWSEPMVELFLLIVKDWKNWEKVSTKKVSGAGLDIIITHKPTGVVFSGVSWIDELVDEMGNVHNQLGEYYRNTILGDKDSSKVITLAKIWKQVHYGDKLARIERINTLRSARIRQEQATKREELAKIARSAEAQKIRDYLEGVGK